MKDQDPLMELEWLRVEKKKDVVEGQDAKALRKLKENPFLPFGVLATTGCLIFGIRAMKKGNVRMSQLMMRGRVIAQGATVASLVIGFCMSAAARADKKLD